MKKVLLACALACAIPHDVLAIYPLHQSAYTFIKYINVTDFGALGDGVNDDYSAIQNAINQAATNGSHVLIPAGTYNCSSTIVVPAGVILIGEGRGQSSTQTPNTGTIIKNTGTHLTVQITGSNAGLRDLTVYDTDNAGALGGVQLLANGSLVESIILDNVLIFGFTDGDALHLKSTNGGGLSYCSFEDLRVRHAKTGIHIEEVGNGFVNSNAFYHGAVSGGGFSHCLFVEGGNNNVFHGTIFEPYSSTIGHLIINQGSITGIDIRIEGTSQPTDLPLIKFEENTYGSRLTGVYSGGLTIDKGDNFINFKSGKSIDFKNASSNLFTNAAFKGVNGNTIPNWEVSAGVTIEVFASEILDQHQVIKLTIPSGVNAYLRPSPVDLPEALSSAIYDHVNFGAYIKTDQPNLVTTICKAPAGITTGGYHPGDSKWHSIGMTSLVDKTTSYNPKFYFQNSGQSNDLVVYLTTPLLTFGLTETELAPKPLTTLGGQLFGTLTMSMQSVNTVTNGFIVLPKDGNIFEINGTNSIYRINHLTSDRFPKGTVINLLFNTSGVSVFNSAYINLTGHFSSTTNGSLTLVSNGNGTWRELNRNL